MRFIRLLLIFLTIAVALVALLALVALTPVAQTWLLERALTGPSGLRASAGSVLAGLSRIDVTDLRLEARGAVLMLPTVEAGLPLKTALWDRKFLAGHLVAKGWTLDLSRQPIAAGDEQSSSAATVAPAGSTGDAVAVSAKPISAQQALLAVQRFVTGWKLPCDVALDDVELEGDVLFASAAGGKPAKVHVTVKGGRLSAGHAGDFAFDATGAMPDSGLPPTMVGAHGRLVVAMDSPRTVNRVEFKGNVSSDGGWWPDDLGVAAAVTAADAGEAAFALDLSRGDRHIAIVGARFSVAKNRWAGTWKLELREADLARLFPGRTLPTLAAAGEGQFDVAPDLTQAHAVGRLHSAASHLEVLVPSLDRLGAMTLDTGFDLTHSGNTVRIDRLDAAVSGPRPVATMQSLQSFSLDERTGNLKTANPGVDWLAGSLQGFPLAWIAGGVDGLAFGGGDLTGDFSVKAADGAFTLSSKAPLAATGVSVQRAGASLAQGLDLSLALVAAYTPRGWQMQGAPLTVSHDGRRLVTIDFKLSPLAETGRRVAIGGTWQADLEAMAAQPGIAGTRWIKGRSASGDFSARVGTAADVTGKIVVVGHDPTRSLTVKGSIQVDAYGGVGFHAPIAIAVGPNGSEFTADGAWFHDKSGPRLDAEITGVNVALEHVGVLAASLSPTLFGAAGPPTGAMSQRDQRPFWGDWAGRVKLDIYRLRVGDQEVNEVAGTFDVDHGSIHLTGGRGAFVSPNAPPPAEQWRRRAKEEAARSVATVQGSMVFDAAAEFPYRVEASAAVDTIDAARWFAPMPSGREATIEGRFAVAGTVTASGRTLPDLIQRRREELRLTSTGGIVRLLKTTVAEAIPETPTPVSDTLGNIGGAVGTLLGRKGGSLSSGKNPLSKETEAVLNFTSQMTEIGYDQLALTAVPGADGTIQLADIALTSPEELLTGTGQIAGGDGRPLRARALGLDLRLGFRGGPAELLTTAGVVSTEKDAQGYALLRQPVHFGGTLEQIDASEWRAVLVKAATQTPVHGKKGG